MEEIIFSLKHYWRFVDCEALELKALSQEAAEKPHEHRPYSETGKASSIIVDIHSDKGCARLGHG